MICMVDVYENNFFPYLNIDIRDGMNNLLLFHSMNLDGNWMVCSTFFS